MPPRGWGDARSSARPGERLAVMVLCFAAMTAALAALYGGRDRLAVAALALCLVLSAGLFLFEIHSAADGFRMPWLRG